METLKFSLEMQAKSRVLYQLLASAGYAGGGKTITYGEAARRIGLKHHRPLRFPLEIIQTACAETQRPNLTVIVIKQGEGMPGDGCSDGGEGVFEQMLKLVTAYDWPPNPWWSLGMRATLLLDLLSTLSATNR